MSKHKEKLIHRSLKASQHNYKENKEMFIGLLK
jgi:hypothetical protein